METYKISITETLEKVVEVKANSLEEAYEKVEWDYRHQVIILDSEDFVCYEIEEV